MQTFLRAHRDELIARCKAKVAIRRARAASAGQLSHGIPLFLDQLTRTLEAETRGDAARSLGISGASGGDIASPSEIGVSAAAHGKELLGLGYSIDQVVHDYGDLCQAITDLAFERSVPFGIDEFRTLNRCLDNAMADAVTEFALQRDAATASQHSWAASELGTLSHIAMLAFAALEAGNLPASGSTGRVLKRNLVALEALLGRAAEDARAVSGEPAEVRLFGLARLVGEAAASATIEANALGCYVSIPAIDPKLEIRGDRARLLAALSHLLHSAIRTTRLHTEVGVRVTVAGGRARIEVAEHGGGLLPENTDGPGLAAARKSIEADGGSLGVRDIPGTGCVFTMELPLAGTP